MKRILCLCGGGAKGIAQIMTLKKLEQDYGKPLHEVYDLVAGSSVGAINAALVASGKHSMEHIEKVYPQILEKVFEKKWYRLIKPTYKRENFIEEWDNLIGNEFKMGDVKTKLMITSVDLVNDTNHFFKSWKPNVYDTTLAELVCRSFAAPIYFGHMPDAVSRKVWSDGGVGYSNLPLNEVKIQAEAFGWYDMNGKGDNKVLIDAVGCLYYGNKSTYEEVSNHRWLKQTLDYMNPVAGGLARAQSVQDQVRIMKYLSRNNPNIKFRYWDSPVYDKKLDTIDGMKYLDKYKYYGEKMSTSPLIDLS
tara:strand:- start:4989 stop:5903 length:915 start_codon:yes stop_codon:yes gene_type:complete